LDIDPDYYFRAFPITFTTNVARPSTAKIRNLIRIQEPRNAIQEVAHRFTLVQALGKENAALWGHRVHGTAEQQDWKPGMERSHAEEQISAVHSGHIEIEDRKIDGRKIVAQYLHRATKQYNCVALQFQNLPAEQ
jgi:hypothetical protein